MPTTYSLASRNDQVAKKLSFAWYLALIQRDLSSKRYSHPGTGTKI